MNRDEILRAAQDMLEQNDEYERDVTRKGLLYATASTVMICIAMCLVEVIIFKRIDFGKTALIFWISAYSLIFEGKRMNNKKKLAGGIIEAIVAVILIILYLGALFV